MKPPSDIHALANSLKETMLSQNWDGSAAESELLHKVAQLRSLLEPSLSTLDQDELQAIGHVLQCLRLTANFRVALEDMASEHVATASDETRTCLDFWQRQKLHGPSKLTDIPVSDSGQNMSSASDQINSSILREWFLSHLDDPFPSREEKERLSRASSNAIAADPSSNEKPLDYSQVMLWYINSRRRSGWTNFFRRFAWEDKTRLAALFAALRDEGDVDEDDEEEDQLAPRRLEELLSHDRSGRPLSPAALKKELQECREGYDKIMDWVRQGTRQKVGDWLDEIVAAADRKRERRRLKRSKKLDAAASAARKRAVDAAEKGGFVEMQGGRDIVQLRHPGHPQQQRLGLGLPPHRRVTRSMAVKDEHDDESDDIAPSDSASRNVSGSSTLSSLEASGPPPLIGGGRLAAYRNPSSSTDSSSVYSQSGSYQSNLYGGHGALAYPTHDSLDLHQDSFASPSIDLIHLPHHLRLGGLTLGGTSYESSLYDGSATSFDFSIPAPGGISLYQHQHFPQPPQSASMTFSISAPGSTPGPMTPMPTPMPTVLQLNPLDVSPGGRGQLSFPLDPALSSIELQRSISAQLLGPPAPYRTPTPGASGPHHHQHQRHASLGPGGFTSHHSRSQHQPLARRLPPARKRTSGTIPAAPKPGVLYAANAGTAGGRGLDEVDLNLQGSA